MTNLPDWLVERAALDEVPPASRERIDRADKRALADQIAALRADNAAEAERHPAAPAIAQIEARIALEARRRTERRRRRIGVLGLAASALAVVVVLLAVRRAPTGELDDGLEPTRPKGATRLLAFRQVGDAAERLPEDTVVRAGDLIQLRYNAGGRGYGLIASLDGAGVVTLHYPASEDAPPEATAVPRDTHSLPHAYALDDAPRFERFFFITANDPIDVQQSLATLRAFARRTDCATAALELPTGLHQWSLRLRKPESP